MARCYMMTDRQGWTDTSRKRNGSGTWEDQEEGERVMEEMQKEKKESGQDKKSMRNDEKTRLFVLKNKSGTMVNMAQRTVNHWIFYPPPA